MKIAVTASGNTPESLADPRFRVASNLIVCDTEKNCWEGHLIMRGQDKKTLSRHTVRFVQQLKPDVLLTGYIDPTSFKRLTGSA